MKYRFKLENVCPKYIEFDLNKDVVTNVKFIGGGCPGNLQALPKLVEGMKVNEIIEKIGGIECGNRNTSCPDQLAQKVKEAYENSKQAI